MAVEAASRPFLAGVGFVEMACCDGPVAVCEGVSDDGEALEWALFEAQFAR
jgi:hypothetical protein